MSKEIREDRWNALAKALGGDPPERIAGLVEELELPSSLRETGVPEEDLEEISEEFADQSEDALEILRRAY